MTKEQKEQKEEYEQEARKYSSLEALANTEGGKILIQGLQKDITAAIDVLAIKYKTASEIELRSACANLAVNLAVLRTMTNAKQNKKIYLEELELFKVDDET